MNIEKELFINGQQLLVGCAGTETGDFFHATIKQLEAKGHRAQQEIYFLMSQAYTYGVMQGKRTERARRKAGADNA